MKGVLKFPSCLSVQIFGKQLSIREQEKHIRNKYTRQIPKEIELHIKYQLLINDVKIIHHQRLNLPHVKINKQQSKYKYNTEQFYELSFPSLEQNNSNQYHEQNQRQLNILNQKKTITVDLLKQTNTPQIQEEIQQQKQEKLQAKKNLKTYINFCSILEPKFKPYSPLHMDKITIPGENQIANYSNQPTELIFIPKFANQLPSFRLRVKFIQNPEGVLIGVIDQSMKNKKRCTNFCSKMISIGPRADGNRGDTKNDYIFIAGEEIQVEYRRRKYSINQYEIVFFVGGQIRISKIKGKMVPFLDLAPNTKIQIFFE